MQEILLQIHTYLYFSIAVRRVVLTVILLIEKKQKLDVLEEKINLNNYNKSDSLRSMNCRTCLLSSSEYVRDGLSKC